MEYTYSKSPMEKYPIYQLGMLLSESPYELSLNSQRHTPLKLYSVGVFGFLMTDLG